jgi:hypothetical protein
MNPEPRARGRPPGSSTVHPDRDKLLHFAVEAAISQTGLGVGRGQSGPADLDACILVTWILSSGQSCAEYMRGLEQWKHLQDFALHLTEILTPRVEKAPDRDVLIRQLRTADHLTVRLAYQRVQATQPWRASVREDVRRAERTRDSLAGKPFYDARFTMEDDDS